MAKISMGIRVIGEPQTRALACQLVLGHEMTHVVNGDRVRLALL
jgi:hypothetical protein